MNEYHPSMSNTMFLDSVMSEIMAIFISMTESIFHRILVKKLGIFDPPSNVHPRNTHFHGMNRRRIDLRVEYKSILLFFAISYMYFVD